MSKTSNEVVVRPFQMENYECIFNALGIAILYFDAKGVLLSANQLAQSLVPTCREKRIPLSDFIQFIFEHSIDVEEQTDLANKACRVSGNTEFSEVVRLNENDFYLVRAIAQPDKSMIVELLDISQNKQRADAVKLLGRSNRILLDAIETSRNGVFIASKEGDKRIIFANKALGEILGWSKSSILGYRLDAFLSTYFHSEWDSIRQVIDNGKNGSFWQKIECEGEKLKWLLLNLSADENCGEGNIIIGFIADETINKLNEVRLLQTQKMEALGKLAGGIAHDINNILSIINGYVRLTETALIKGNDTKYNLERIKNAVDRGSGLIRKLLMFGKHRINENAVLNLCALLKDIQSLLKPLLGENIRLHIDLPDEPIYVRGMQEEIYQMVMNLVINARDAMPDGGDISISLVKQATEDMSHAFIRVADTGQGIEKDIIDKIFDPFFTTKEQGEGTGLGLYMVYTAIKQIEGEIQVASSLGEGTTFTIKIPLADKEVISNKTISTLNSSTNLANKTILVAEDEVDLLDIIEADLSELGMRVLRARNGNEALVAQDEFEGKIDFLLTDMVMPQLGGIKLSAIIKEIRPETHIIFMSGYPVRGQINHVELPDDAVFIAKPFESDSLRYVLEQVLYHKDFRLTEMPSWQ